MSTSYDNWKITDINHESQCVEYDDAVKVLERVGCKCENKNVDKFKHIMYNGWTEKSRGKSYKCFTVTAVCKKCKTDFNYTSEPDWDSMRND